MIYVTGDMHGDESRFYSKEFKELQPHDTLIVTGDFGFVWDGSKKEKKMLKYLGSRKYNVCFIDGPHDNYDRIYSYRETIWHGGRVHRISGRLFHLCRGQIFNFEGCSIFTFGGGESADKDLRNENQIWFKEELPTPRQMTIGAKNLDDYNCKVDFIITHEPPSVVKRAMQMRQGKTIYTNKLNGYLEELGKNCEFRQWYFGSFHEDRNITPKYTSVYRELIPINEFIEPEIDGKIKYDDEAIDNESIPLEDEVSTTDKAEFDSDVAAHSSGFEEPKPQLSDLFIKEED